MNRPDVITTGTPPQPSPPNAPKRRRRLWWKIVALTVGLLMVVPVVSYTEALTAPGYASWQDRSVGWIRDNGGAGLVNAIENWWYTVHAPANEAPAAAVLPGVAQQYGGPAKTHLSAPSGNASTVTPPAPVAPLAGAATIPGEGKWAVGATGAAGQPVIYTTFLRPDPDHASVVAGVAWIPVGATRAHLVPGTKQPSGWGGSAAIPSADIPSLVATFNSGWKFKDMDGGFYLNGHENPVLQQGLASVVIDTQGRITVGEWGRDVSMGHDVVAVRQNLHLVVDNGAPVSGLDANAIGLWGSSRNQSQYTWRSGLGTDAAGNLIYVAGNGLTLQTLARAMSDAGIRRGMQLDIHSKMVNFAIWAHPANAAAESTNLLPDMGASPTRYLAADQRDFFYLTLK